MSQYLKQNVAIITMHYVMLYQCSANGMTRTRVSAIIFTEVYMDEVKYDIELKSEIKILGVPWFGGP